MNVSYFQITNGIEKNAEQYGAVEARRAHNPEVSRSKRDIATYLFLFLFFYINRQLAYGLSTSHSLRVTQAKRITINLLANYLQIPSFLNTTECAAIATPNKTLDRVTRI